MIIDNYYYPKLQIEYLKVNFHKKYNFKSKPDARAALCMQPRPLSAPDCSDTPEQINFTMFNQNMSEEFSGKQDRGWERGRKICAMKSQQSTVGSQQFVTLKIYSPK